MIFWFISLMIEIEGFNPKKIGCVRFKGELILQRYLIFQYSVSTTPNIPASSFSDVRHRFSTNGVLSGENCRYFRF